LNESIRGLSFENNPIFKSFALVRFFILICVINILFINKILNIKKFFFISLICTSFVSLDVILQYFSGTDLFGYKSYYEINSGPFGNEYIAGSYLQRFSFFSFFYIFIFFDNKKIKNYLLISIGSIHAIAILLAGNKIPMIMFLIGGGLIFLFIKKTRLVISSILFMFLISFFAISNTNSHFKNVYAGFFAETNILNFFEEIKDKKEKDLKNNKIIKEGEKYEKTVFLRGSYYGAVFRTAIATWKENPFFGSGLKSFRINCWKIGEKMGEDGTRKFTCSTHPHNYYLELLVEAGIVGTLLMIFFLFILAKKSFLFILEYIRTKNSRIIPFIPIIIIFLLEIWPLRSQGSFFTTSNATFFWLNISLLFLLLNKSASISSEV